MKILFFSENIELKELLCFQLAAEFELEVAECSSEKAALKILRDDSGQIVLVIAPWESSTALFFKTLKDKKETVAVIFNYDPAHGEPDRTVISGLNCLATISNRAITTGMPTLIRGFLADKDVKTTPTIDFCPIRTSLLIRAAPLHSNIYIRLSPTKFVKIFNAGDHFDQNDLKKYYETKKIEYMYLKKNETAEFLSQFQRELDSLLGNESLTHEEGMAANESTQETIHELIHRIGFTEEVQTIVKKNVQLALKLVSQNQSLSSMLHMVISGGNYISLHSTLLAHISCCIAKEMDWGSDATFSKLILASYMHDVSITNPELAKIKTLRELDSKKELFSGEEVKGFAQHPARSAEMVRKFHEIPPDVDIIVMQHHERPGEGFPRGLSPNYVALLPSVFIIAHEITQAVIEKREQFSLTEFISDKKKSFSQGNFKKVISVLERVSSL